MAQQEWAGGGGRRGDKVVAMLPHVVELQMTRQEVGVRTTQCKRVVDKTTREGKWLYNLVGGGNSGAIDPGCSLPLKYST